jgi:hypothetical protein
MHVRELHTWYHFLTKIKRACCNVSPNLMHETLLYGRVAAAPGAKLTGYAYTAYRPPPIVVEDPPSSDEAAAGDERLAPSRRRRVTRLNG